MTGDFDISISSPLLISLSLTLHLCPQKTAGKYTHMLHKVDQITTLAFPSWAVMFEFPFMCICVYVRYTYIYVCLMCLHMHLLSVQYLYIHVQVYTVHT